MSAVSTIDRIRRVLEEMGRDAVTYDLMPETTVVSLQLDSLEFAQFVLDLEEEFHIEVPEDDYRQLRTLADLVKYADSKSAAA